MARKIRNTDDAMRHHRSKHADKVLVGRAIAQEICNEQGDVRSYEVTARMLSRGHIDESDARRWVGSIFRYCQLFKPTGRTEKYSDEAKNVHQANVVVWALA